MPMPCPRTILRNARLMAESAVQHLVDDPALLAVQVSRRLPFRARIAVGSALSELGRRAPGGAGIGALGAFMAGDRELAAVRAVDASVRGSRLGAETALLVNRADAIGDAAPVQVRARAAWAAGDLSTAVDLLEQAGRGTSLYTRRLRSEMHLLEPGNRLQDAAEAGTAQRPAHYRRASRAVLGPDEPLRVLHLLTNSLPHTQSGYSLRSHRILRAQQEQGMEVLALTRPGYPVMIGVPLARDEDVVDGVRYRRTLPWSLGATQEDRVRAQVREALCLVEEFRPHVLHATTNYLNGLVAQAVSAETGIPWVYEVRGFMEQTWAVSHHTAEAREHAHGSERYRRIAQKETELVQAADAVVTLSETMAQHLVARGVPREAIMLAPNATTPIPPQDLMDAQQARRSLGDALPPHFASPHARLVGAASALVDYEGFDVLLEAVALLLRDPAVPASLRDQLGVVLVGDGVSRPALLRQADRLGITDRVLMPGRVPSRAARRWVQALDVVTVPRRDSAVTRVVTPQKPAEAMALGKPVVASDLPAIRETLAIGVGESSPMLARPGDPVALAAALQPALERSQMFVRSVGGAATWTDLACAFQTLYSSLLDAPHEARHAA